MNENKNNQNEQQQPLNIGGVSVSLPSSEVWYDRANKMLQAYKNADPKLFPTMPIRAEAIQEYINYVLGNER